MRGLRVVSRALSLIRRRPKSARVVKLKKALQLMILMLLVILFFKGLPGS